MKIKFYILLFLALSAFNLYGQQLSNTPPGEKLLKLIFKTPGRKVLSITTKNVHLQGFGNIFIAPDGTDI